MAVIIGLGNPGHKYDGSRHNVGLELINALADSFSLNFKSGKGPYSIAKTRHGRQQLLLIKPTTFMNNSGNAVQKVLQWFKISPASCLICYDDLNLDVGTIRLRPGGSGGGHNGVKDIIQKLGTDKFPRLRIGIGDDFRAGQQVQFVLSPFNSAERKILDDTLKKSIDAVLTFAEQGIDQAMNKFN